MTDRSTKLAFSADISLSGVPCKVCLLRSDDSETQKTHIFLQAGLNLKDQGISLESLITYVLGKSAKKFLDGLFLLNVSLDQLVTEVCVDQKRLLIVASISLGKNVQIFSDMIDSSNDQFLEKFSGNQNSKSFGVFMKKQASQPWRVCVFVDGPPDLYAVETVDDRKNDKPYQSLYKKLENVHAICNPDSPEDPEDPEDPNHPHEINSPSHPPDLLPPLVIVSGLGKAAAEGIGHLIRHFLSHRGNGGSISSPEGEGGGDGSDNHGSKEKPGKQDPPYVAFPLPLVNLSELVYHNGALDLSWRKPIFDASRYDIKLTSTKNNNVLIREVPVDQTGQTQASIKVPSDLEVGEYTVSIQPQATGWYSVPTKAKFTVTQLQQVEITSMTYGQGTLTVLWKQPISGAEGYIARLVKVGENNIFEEVGNVSPVIIKDGKATKASLSIPHNLEVNQYRVQVQTYGNGH